LDSGSRKGAKLKILEFLYFLPIYIYINGNDLDVFILFHFWDEKDANYNRIIILKLIEKSFKEFKNSKMHNIKLSISNCNFIKYIILSSNFKFKFQSWILIMSILY